MKIFLKTIGENIKTYLITAAGIMFFIVIIVGALTMIRNFNRQPSVILRSTECDPPCWYGIQPGQTNSWQVYAILDQLNDVNKNTIMGEYDRNDVLSKIYWYFQRPAEDSIGSIYFDNDRVTAISILTINSLKLADLFKKLGQPEKYWTEIGHGEDREYLEVMLFYPTQGYVADVIIDIESNTNQVEIRETTPVFRVTYFDPDKYQQLLGTRILIDKAELARKGSFQTWSGFGTISPPVSSDR